MTITYIIYVIQKKNNFIIFNSISRNYQCLNVCTLIKRSSENHVLGFQTTFSLTYPQTGLPNPKFFRFYLRSIPKCGRVGRCRTFRCRTRQRFSPVVCRLRSLRGFGLHQRVSRIRCRRRRKKRFDLRCNRKIHSRRLSSRH